MNVMLFGGPKDGEVIEAEGYNLAEHNMQPGMFYCDGGAYLFELKDKKFIGEWKELIT